MMGLREVQRATSWNLRHGKLLNVLDFEGNALRGHQQGVLLISEENPRLGDMALFTT
jgi:hypothetical protein